MNLLLPSTQTLTSAMPVMADFPMVPIHVSDNEALYNVLDWQRKGAQYMLRHYLKSDAYLQATIEQCRYFDIAMIHQLTEIFVYQFTRCSGCKR